MVVPRWITYGSMQAGFFCLDVLFCSSQLEQEFWVHFVHKKRLFSCGLGFTSYYVLPHVRFFPRIVCVSYVHHQSVRLEFICRSILVPKNKHFSPMYGIKG